MNGCYAWSGNYGIAIILFTFCSKIILLPVSVWTHLNSIKMVKIQPEINFLKVRYYGQKDVIAEEESALYKKEGYHPLVSTIPLIIQLILMMGVVGVIRLGIANPGIDMRFLGVNLGDVPCEKGISLLYSPILAGLSSLVLCVTQNASNVLQAEQSKWNKYGTMVFSVALSLYLGWFVPVGTAWYWIWSNLLAVVQMYILNAVIKPGKYVDYEKLERSRQELAKLNEIGSGKKSKVSREDKKREKADYKRFFSVLNKHLVIYSEASGFYKYYKGFVEYILQNSNLTIHYITSDPKDQIFDLAQKNPQIRAYYIGENRLITLMMKMDADIVVMTMPDLDTYHIKRSYVRNDIEYINVQHGMGSLNLTYRKGALDHFDTVFCAGPHHKEELQKTGALRDLPAQNLIEVGYPLLDDMQRDYVPEDRSAHSKIKILIAPSWQKDNIIDSCLEEMLDQLKGRNYDITVRPHPQEVRLKQSYMNELKAKYDGVEGIEIQTDFSSNNTVMEADILITDWSDISWEYTFTTYRPVLFIDTPMKIMNPDYQLIDTIPLNILLRERVGRHLAVDDMEQLPDMVQDLLDHADDYRKAIEEARKEFIYNHGSSARVGASYILEQVKKKIEAKKKNP